ncbi:MAG: glycosyltransferase, partial [Ginsengibacter sp.]
NNIRQNKLKKFFLLIQSFKERNKILLKIHQERKIDAIVLLDTIVWDLIPLIRFAKSNNIKIVHERTEYPFVVGGNGLIMKLNLKIYLSYVIKRFDGIYVISNALKKYFDQLLNNKIPIEIINMIVDPDRFITEPTNEISTYKYIAYCGSLNDSKDGVDILIESFGEALSKKKINSDIKLILVGDCKVESFQKKLEHIIEEKNCKNNIIFTGKVERLKVPELLNGADALALARPDSMQAEGGFPTKLGEYLATGKPVIITSVGEICNFLKDGENAFVAKPGNVNSFSEKITQVFADYPKAMEIGKNGEQLVYNEFNYFKQAEKLADFIESL